MFFAGIYFLIPLKTDLYKMNLERYREILKEVKEFQYFLKKEKNIFSIGGKGHYENPISDILAFFLKPDEEHSFGNLCLTSLLNCIPSSSCFNDINIDLVKSISREHRTNKGNRIDIFIEGENWTLTIENKIRASVKNPLEDYCKFVKEQYPNKKNYFLLLSVNKFQENSGWQNVLYRNLVEKIKLDFGKYYINENIRSNSKWIILLREFLLNLNSEYGDGEVDKKIIEFVDNNFTEINELINHRDNYFSYLTEECSKKIAEQNLGDRVEHVRHIWGNWAIAIRSYVPDRWGKKTNIAFAVCNDKTFKIRVYVYDVEPNGQLVRLKEIFKGYEFWSEANDTIKCFGIETIRSREECFDYFSESVKKLNLFFAR